MKYSFILCTLNRPNELKKCIDSILNQSYKNYEIIIIDQSDKKNNYFLKYDERIKYIYTKERGLSHCRNIAISMATGNYCCLMDDDAEYEKDTLYNINKNINEKKLDVVSGVIIDKLTNEKWMKSMPNKECKINKNNVFSCSSASLTIKTKLLKENLFDEQLGAGKKWGCGEETDLLLRLLYKKKKIFYSPSIIIFHPKEPLTKINKEKIYKYNLGYGAYFYKHIKYYNNKKMILYFLKAIIKNIIGITVFFPSRIKRNYYKTCLIGKVKGYKEYKKEGIFIEK